MRRSNRPVLTLMLLLLLPTSAFAELQTSPEALAANPEHVLHDAVQVGEQNGAPVWRKEIFSKIYDIDGKYTSMRGPMGHKSFRLLDGKPELLWIVGYEAMQTSPDGTTNIGDEFMCHSNLDLDRDAYSDRFPTQLIFPGGRLFTLSQGQVKVHFPDGFGTPVMSDQEVSLTSQVLNHNLPDANFQTRQRVVIDFIRDRDLPEILTPLIQNGVEGLKLLSGPDGFLGHNPDSSDSAHGEGCSLGTTAGDQANTRKDSFNRKLTAFWVLPQGREVSHTPVTLPMRLPYDTKIHYIAAHMHPFAESLELRDMTTGDTVYKTNVRGAEGGRIGISEVEYYSSTEGLPLYRNHEYELISTYNNTSGTDQDAMATMMIYVEAKDLYDFQLRNN